MITISMDAARTIDTQVTLPMELYRKRIIRKIGELEPEYLTQIDTEIWRTLKPSE